MKKILYLFLCLLLLPVFAIDRLHVKALENFDTAQPKNTFKVELIENGSLNHNYLLEGAIINCSLERVTDPKRAKRDAKIYFNLDSYIKNNKTYTIYPEMVARYAKTILSVEEVKKNPPLEGTKTAVRTVGGAIIPGFSYAFSFIDGMKQNKEDNRLKSGVKKIYDDSLISMVEYGEQIIINEGDEFYLIVRANSDDEEVELTQGNGFSVADDINKK